jgi:hypothetical protein
VVDTGLAMQSCTANSCSLYHKVFLILWNNRTRKIYFKIKNSKTIKLSEVEELKSKFNFLSSECHYLLVSVDNSYKESNASILYYCNEITHIQKFASRDTWFHIEFCKFQYGIPAQYDDTTNSFGFETLAKIDSSYNDDNFCDFSVG